MELELLLAHADDQRPVLESGLPDDSLGQAPASAQRSQTHKHLWDPGGDANDLAAQRWAVMAPEGPAGDRLLALVAPLRQWREQQQGAPARCFRVAPGLGGPDAVRWKNTVLRDESLPEREWPRYLLILGDPEQVSLEFQQGLGSDVFVGRLAFRDERGLSAYVDKVLRWERSPSMESRARSLFFTAHDGTAATRVGYQQLVLPSLQACRTRQQRGELNADIQEVGNTEEWSAQQLLDQVAMPRPGVLLSVSHGLGAPRKGWASASEQQALQGAMSLGPGEHLRAEDVASRPFLPGGFWVYLACFGGGTPRASPYFHWLRRLQDAGARLGNPEAVLASLPKAGEPPFIAALPQAALANPDGPLALIAHVDLAWSYGFSDVDTQTRGRASRFLGLLRELVEGRRAGVGLSALLRFASEANLELTLLEDGAESDRAAGRANAQDGVRRGHLWMMRQDVSGYVLLGDPAVRLPLAQATARAVTPSVSNAAALLGLPVGLPAAVSSGPGVQGMEEAVVALMTGAESPKAIAARAGVSLAELRHWERTFREAGRAALAALSGSKGQG
ncbi:hypothetical protein BO221_39400 [Archangium sp. Cb G35]|uniref:C25 family cysteine peptidase n=1 Tax=Archangium sp. Cb G35 TaxID=1920190 RepID=UPI0009375AD3|nr:C25 family cysteine peptidase [Archangium sp. Cb G35]OJT18797.1 hypothetical protein BO221_39400 [Archangium sp. Cb G35]